MGRAWISFLLLVVSQASASPQLLQEGPTPDEAVRVHEARAHARPGDAEALLYLARALVHRAEFTGAANDYDRAWEVLAQARALDRDEPRVTRDQASLLLSRHRFVMARAVAEAAMSKHPNQSDLHAIAGDAAIEAGDLNGAQSHYGEYHRLAPGYESLFRLGHLEEMRGRFDAAADLMGQGYASAETKGAGSSLLGWFQAMWGEMELKSGRKALARRHYEAGLAQSPDHPLLLEHLAELETAEGHLDAAEVAYRKLLKTDGIHPLIQLRLGTLIAKQKPDEAAAIRAEVYTLLQRLVTAGNEGYLRPLAEMELEKANYQRAAALACHDLNLRPNAQSRDLLANILAAAARAGQPIIEFDRATSSTGSSQESARR